MSIALCGCLSSAERQPAVSGAPEMRPETFFAGRTEGRGELSVRGRAPRSLQVVGQGRTEPDGSFRLDQTVTYGDGSVTTRTWHLRAIDARSYTGTLSDADGEVHGEVSGNVFHLRYRMRQPAVRMEQWLYLQSDGRSVVNLSEITILGVLWARLEEEIVRSEASR